MQKYNKLDKTVEYDKEAVDQLASALNEIIELERQIADLKVLVEENHELRQFVWRTQENEVIAIHNLADDHLTNILKHQVRHGRSINKALRSEARKRQVLIPSQAPIGVDPAYFFDEMEGEAF